MLRFIHIPRTGGSYIKQSGAISPICAPYGHNTIAAKAEDPNYLFYPRDEMKKYWYDTHVIMKEGAQKYDFFTNVRNPFSWLVCHYGFRPSLKEKNTFKEYVNKITKENYWPWKRFLYLQMFCSDGTMIVDWVNHMEQLDLDLRLMAEYYGLKYKKKKRVKVSPHRDYKTYYDDKLIDVVNNRWARELELFGYSFDGLTKKPIIRHLNVMKDRINYFVKKDRMLIDGKEYRG